MKAVRVEQSIIGYTVGRPIFTESGSLLLKKGATVDNNILDKLSDHNIDYIYLTETETDSKSEIDQAEPIIGDQSYAGSVCAVKEVFDEVMNKEKHGVKVAIPPEHLDLVHDIIQSLIAALEESEDVLYAVTDLLDTDQYTYKHSVNVAILSILTARALNYSKGDIKNIAFGALLHDIGKARISEKLIKKPSALSVSERKIVEGHPELGYELMQTIDNLPYSTKQIVRLHHEKMDGSGYPLGLTDMEIPEYVKIVTVCDMFDAMTSDRVYRSKMPVYRALDILMAEAIYRIDPEIYRVMTSNICIFPVGLGVLLSDGRIGIISSYRRQNPSRPKVRILAKTVENKIEIQEVSLEEKKNLFIEDTWDVESFVVG